MTSPGDVTVNVEPDVWTYPSLGFRLAVAEVENPISGEPLTVVAREEL